MIETLGELVSYLAQGGGLEESLLLALFLVGMGLIFILAEIFFVSFGLLTLCSIGSFAGAVMIGFNRSTGWGAVFIIMEIILFPIMIVVGLRKMPRTRWGRRLIPASPELDEVGGTGVPEEFEALLGKEGVTMSMCRPAGTADIDGRRYDVVSESMTIPKDKSVKVLEVEGNRIVVREIEQSASS